MKELDLHGMLHSDVEDKVEDFVLVNSTKLPIRIITGNSVKMKELTKKVLDKHKFGYEFSFHNPGEIIVKK